MTRAASLADAHVTSNYLNHESVALSPTEYRIKAAPIKMKLPFAIHPIHYDVVKKDKLYKKNSRVLRIDLYAIEKDCNILHY